MKKIFSGLLSMAFAITLSAQTTNVPLVVQQCVQKDYRPVAALRWQQMSNNWWRASYLSGNEAFTKSCGDNGVAVIVALPVLQTSVEPHVVSALIGKYGPEIYDITKTTGSNGRTEYVVRILQQGQIRTERSSEP